MPHGTTKGINASLIKLFKWWLEPGRPSDSWMLMGDMASHINDYQMHTSPAIRAGINGDSPDAW